MKEVETMGMQGAREGKRERERKRWGYKNDQHWRQVTNGFLNKLTVCTDWPAKKRASRWKHAHVKNGRPQTSLLLCLSMTAFGL